MNCEPLFGDCTTNPLSGLTDAVMEPDANLVADGKLNKLEPSPSKVPLNEPLNDALISLASILSLTNKLPVTVVSPINLISAGLTILSTILILPPIAECN